MIQFIRETGPKNHTNEAIRRRTHPKHTKSTRLAQSPTKKPNDRDTGPRNRVTAEAEQLDTKPNQDGTRRRTAHPKRQEELASERQDLAGPVGSIVREESTTVYIAPKTPTLHVDFISLDLTFVLSSDNVHTIFPF
jgi:hypothetical protein